MDALIAFGGVLLGAALSWVLTRYASDRERRFRAEDLVRQRRDGAAERLRDDLDVLEDALPDSGTGREVTDQLGRCDQIARAGQARAMLLRDQDILERLDALAYALTILWFDSEEDPDRGMNRWALSFGISDLRAALDAFLLREEPPERTFPSTEEIREIVGEEAVGFPKINQAVRHRWLQARRESGVGSSG